MDTQEQTPGPGHNLPPEEQEFGEIITRADTLIDAANLWLKERQEFTDEEMAEKCSDFMDQLSTLAKRVETHRTDQLEPHKVATDEINGKCYPLHHKGKKTGKIDVALRLLKAPLTVWLEKQEKARQEAAAEAEAEALEKGRQAEEAKKKAETETDDIVGATVAAEKAEKEAEESVKEADRATRSRTQVQSYSGGGRTKALRTTNKAEITDYSLALAYYGNRQEVRELVQRLASADARTEAKRQEGVPGVKFYTEKKAA